MAAPKQSDILVELEEDEDLQSASNRDEYDALAGWVLGYVDEWEDYRDTNYKERWDEYYRLWRGIWTPEDKRRTHERSKIISPALQQAVEVAVAELEEATFSRKRWFDIQQDMKELKEHQDKKAKLERMKAQLPKLPQSEQQPAMFQIQEIEKELDEAASKETLKLLEEFELNEVPAAISETYLNGALYGNGISKLVVEDVEEPQLDGTVKTRFSVKLVPVQPDQFVIDPVAKGIDDAMGMAHIMDVPRHTVISKIVNGKYRSVDIGMQVETTEDVSEKDETSFNDKASFVKITEWHGLVPKSLLYPLELEEDEELVELIPANQMNGQPPLEEEDDMVEAIVTIANDSVVLKAVENPYLMKDRAFVAYQHDTVPNRFWGRGVAEKGYNSQIGLDSELRARIDGLALSTYPMLAIDSTRIPRGADYSVRPGRNIFTVGNPAEALREFKFTPPSGMSFNQTAEFERMVQMGTGSMDSATPIGVSPRNQTASGMSMISAGSMKRNKRTMQNIERNYLDKLVEKAMWRYMQFDPEKFPAKDFKFLVHSTMGIAAREFEQQQLTQLLQTAPPGSPVYWMLIKSMYVNSSIETKEEVLPLIEQMLNASINPPPQKPEPKDEIAKADLDFRMKQHDDQQKAKAQELKIKMIEAIATANLKNSDAKNKQAEAIKFIAQAESEEVGKQIEMYTAVMQGLAEGDSESASQTS